MAVVGTDLVIVERDGVLHKSTAGDIAGLAGGGSDPLVLSDDTPTTPDSDTVTVFRKAVANRQMSAFVGPVGSHTVIQSFLARNEVGIWLPSGNTNTTPVLFGIPSLSMLGFTATGRNVATTSLFTRIRRMGYVTAATAGTVGNFRAASAQYTLGTGSLGGFFYVVRFGISDAATVAGARMFMGMVNKTSMSNEEPSALINAIGIGHGASDTNFKIYYAGTTPQAPINLGANFPCNTRNTDMYELALFAPVDSAVCHYEVTRLNTGHVATGTLTGTAGVALPSSSTLLAAPWGYRTNNATALAVGLDVASVYIETDY